jgi:proteasome lid subunit RPN8/RPN11
VRELAERGRSERESGAFLLARTARRPHRVAAIVFFDDLDPEALNGAISIRRAAFGRLWEICAERRMRVVADVHTHPGPGVGQSDIDAANPMVVTCGHFAVILPHFASRAPQPRDAGVHVYQGDRSWTNAFGEDAGSLIRRTWW